jgi:hypothetical protein
MEFKYDPRNHTKCHEEGNILVCSGGFVDRLFSDVFGVPPLGGINPKPRKRGTPNLNVPPCLCG